VTRLSDKYKAEVVPAMMERFGYTNPMAVPRVEKVVISMGLGKGRENPKFVDTAVADLTTIAGQRAVQTRARKSVSNFRVREGDVVGAMVTLRGPRMYEFLDRLVSVVIPRVRDFRGLRPDSFDDQGSFSMGLTDQLVFPEIRSDKVEHAHGMNVTITVRRSNPAASLELLRLFGMPFRGESRGER
jgi:large subunit ribosomal protein L5